LSDDDFSKSQTCSQTIKLIKIATDLRFFLSAIQTQFPSHTKHQPPITDAKQKVIPGVTRKKVAEDELNGAT